MKLIINFVTLSSAPPFVHRNLNNLTPIQLYTVYSIGSELFDEQDVTNLEGDSDDMQSDIVEEESVVVPTCHIPLSVSSMQELCAEINSLVNCNDFGYQLYLDTVQKLFTLMTNDGLLV